MSESAVATLSASLPPTPTEEENTLTSEPNELFSPIPDPKSPTPPPADLSPKLDETIAEVAANCSPTSEHNALIIDENPGESDEQPPKLELAEIKEEEPKEPNGSSEPKPQDQPENLSLKAEQQKEEPKIPEAAPKIKKSIDSTVETMLKRKNWTTVPKTLTAVPMPKPPTLAAALPAVSAVSSLQPETSLSTQMAAPAEPKKKPPPKPKKPAVPKKETTIPVTSQPHILMYCHPSMMVNNQFALGMPYRPTLQGARMTAPIYLQQPAALTSTVSATTTTPATSATTIAPKSSISRKPNGNPNKPKEPVVTQATGNPVQIDGKHLFPVNISSRTIVQPMMQPIGNGQTVQQFLARKQPVPTTMAASGVPQYFIQSGAAAGTRFVGVRQQPRYNIDQLMVLPNGTVMCPPGYMQSDCPPPPTLSPNPSIQSSSSSKSPKPLAPSKRKNDAPSLTAFNANPDDDAPPKIEKEGRDFEMSSSDIRQRAQQSFLNDAIRSNRQQQKAGQNRTIVHQIDGYAIEETIGSANKPTKSPKKPTTAVEEFRAISRKSLNGFSFNIVPAASVCAASSVSSSGNSTGQSGVAKSRPLTGAAARSAAAKSARTHSGALRSRLSERDAPEVVKTVNKILLESKVGQSPTKSAADSTSRKRLSTRRGGDQSRGSSAEPTKKDRMDATAAPMPGVSKRRHRELQELLTMDFGKGKSPFTTTSVSEYSKEILTSRQRLQAASTTPNAAALDESGRDSRLSSTSKSRRSHRQSSATSSVDVPQRPRRSQLPVRRFYEGGSELDEEEEDEDEEEETLDDEEEAPAAKIKRDDRSQCCYECGKPRFNSKGPLYPKSPQYCSAHCKEAFRKKTRLERTLNTKFPANIDSPNDSRAGSRLNNSKLSTHSSPANAAVGPNRSAMNSPAAAVANGAQRLSATSFGSLPANSGHNGSGSANASTSNPDLEDLKAMGVANWNPQEVARWATIVTGSEQIGEKFAEQDVDGDALLILNQQNLRDELGIKLGPAVKIINELKQMQERH